MSKRIIEDSSVLVTGGAGFIGSNLCEALLAQGNKVTCLDNFATGRRENIEELIGKASFKLVEGDIRNYQDCINALEGMEYVLHQAALGSVPRSINDPVTTNNVNVSGFVNMLNASREAGIKRFVYAASSSTYGDHPDLPKVEEKIGKPLSPYAVSKYVNELYAKVFSDIYGIETIGLRYFNVFGRRQDPNGAYAAAIPKFISALISGESPTIHGDGNQSRDFTYIDNVIQVNQLAALSTNPDCINTVYNVACGEQTTLNELMELLKKNLSRYKPEVANVEILYGEERKGDVKHSLASIEKAQTLLGYTPEYNMKMGIENSIEWYRNSLTKVNHPS